MNTINVQATPTDDGWRCAVTVEEGGGRTEHAVTLDRATYERLSDGAVPPETLVRESFAFLLEREPKESILRQLRLAPDRPLFPRVRSRHPPAPGSPLTAGDSRSEAKPRSPSLTRPRAPSFAQRPHPRSRRKRGRCPPPVRRGGRRVRAVGTPTRARANPGAGGPPWSLRWPQWAVKIEHMLCDVETILRRWLSGGMGADLTVGWHFGLFEVGGWGLYHRAVGGTVL